MTKNGLIDFAQSLAICMKKYDQIYGVKKIGGFALLAHKLHV
jgi:hypothetical protein